jgi:hypothetical protein
MSDGNKVENLILGVHSFNTSTQRRGLVSDRR